MTTDPMTAPLTTAMHSALGEKIANALAALVAETGAWSGAGGALGAALGAHVGERDRAWVAALDGEAITELVDQAELDRAELRLWVSQGIVRVVSDKPRPLDEAALAGQSPDEWRRRQVELFAERGNQEDAEAGLVAEWTAARARRVAAHLCAFCGLGRDISMAVVDGAAVHAGCKPAAERQQAAWRAAFLDLVRQRPIPLPVAWDDPEPSPLDLPIEEQPIAQPTPAGLGDRIRLFLAERCDLAPGLEEDRSALFEAWAEWCALRRIDPGALDSFRMNIQQASPTINPAPRPTVSGRLLWRGVQLRAAEPDDIDIAATTPREVRSDDALMATFAKLECRSGSDIQIPARDLFGVWARWAVGRGSEPGELGQFIERLRAVVPSIELRKTRGLRQTVLHGIGLRAPR